MRTPSDVLHLIVGVLLVLLGLAVAAGASNTLVGFERDTISAFDFLPEAVARALYYLFQGFASLIPAAVGLFVLWKRRFRLFGMLILAAIVAQSIASLLNGLVVERFGRPELLAAVERPAWLREVASIGVIDSNFIAGMVSTVVLGSPWISRPWRRLGWAIVVIAVLFRAAAAQDGPLDIVLAVGAGIVGGSVVLLVFGAPNRRPRGPAVVAAMARAGIPLRRLERAGVDARSSTPYFGEAEDGRALFLKVLGRDERSADLMFRIYRFLRLKDVGDRGPFTSLQRMVEHEALVALYANDSGVLTPRLVVTTNVGDDGFLLAYERTAGDSLDRVEDEALTDDVLREHLGGGRGAAAAPHRAPRPPPGQRDAGAGRPPLVHRLRVRRDRGHRPDAGHGRGGAALVHRPQGRPDAGGRRGHRGDRQGGGGERRAAHPAARPEHRDAQVAHGAQAALRRPAQVRRRGQRRRRRGAAGPAAHQAAHRHHVRRPGADVLHPHPAAGRRERRAPGAAARRVDAGRPGRWPPRWSPTSRRRSG